MFHQNEIKMVSKDQRETSFHIDGREIVPYPNFELARLWYSSRKLTSECEAAMEWILESRLHYFA